MAGDAIAQRSPLRGSCGARAIATDVSAFAFKSNDGELSLVAPANVAP
jgi:hypothetical protein